MKSLFIFMLLTICGYRAIATDEVLRISALAEFYECRHSLNNVCTLWLDSDPNLEINLIQGP